jgi:uncharacterized protein (TIGR01777 family)
VATIDSAASLAEGLAASQTVLITGGTGLVGTRLVAALAEAGHRVIVLSRWTGRNAALPAKVQITTSLDELAADTRIDAVVNLAGEPLANGLWTKAKRERIVQSRLGVTEACLTLMKRLKQRPAVFVSASAIGWYGLRGDEELDETSGGTDCFSRQVCVAIEGAAQRAEALGVRTVRLRIGLVLAAGGGLLGRMILPFKLGLGGPFGRGRHWMSWIHRDDLVRLICHCIASPALSGAVNGTAPEPVTQPRLSSPRWARRCNRPAILPVLALPLQWALGDFAKELLLSGQRVLPRAAQASGFAFRYPQLSDALKAILKP